MSNNNLGVYAEDDEVKKEDAKFIFSLLDSLFFAYRMSLGDFDTGNLGLKH
jgi:hypothetical protein